MRIIFRWDLIVPVVVPLIVFVGLIFGAGCANPVNAHTFNRYYDAAVAAEDRGDLVQARQYYHRMFVNTQMGFLGPEAEAHALYEWGRVSGYLGKRDDVEMAFPRVFELIDKAKGKADALRAPALSEFARYLHDTDQHERAVSAFRDALKAAEDAGAEKKDPIGLADFLDDYAKSLKHVGQTSESGVLSNRAASLRSANRGVAPHHKPERYR